MNQTAYKSRQTSEVVKNDFTSRPTCLYFRSSCT